MKSKIILCIGIGVTLFSCSIRKVDKTTHDEKLETKTESISSTYSESENNHQENTFIQRSDFSQWFNFTHEPLFDQFGQPIPLIIEHTINGQTEKLVISGASVKGGQSTNQNQEEERKFINTYSKHLLISQTQTIYKSHYTYKTKVREKIAIGPQSIYNILFCGIIIVLAALAFTGHWGWLKNVASKIIKYLRNN